MYVKKDPEITRLKRLLEIEKSLDKVSDVAMRMKTRADMPGVCKAIAQQLQRLGVQEIRNVQTAIFYTDRGTYMNYEYYAKHDKTFITDTSYTNHKIAKAFATKMLKGKGECMIKHIKGDKVKEWIAYQKTTNVFIDSFLKKAASLSYYWFSLGSVALGISTYAPLKEDDLDLFKRFLNVFELAYTRYFDIEKAEERTREAQIEAALEKIRSRSLAMHKSDELKDVVAVLFKKLRELGLDFDGTGIQLFKEGSKDSVLWIQGVILSAPVLVNHPYDEDVFNNSEIFRDIWLAKEKGEPVFNKSYSFEEKNKLVEYTWKYNKENGTPPEVAEAMMRAPGYTATFIMEKNSGLWVDSWSGKKITTEEFNVSKRAAKVFEQAYIRFLDLQKAEAQAREAEIQLALERVRARAMAMQKSGELSDAVYILFQQFKELGENPDQATIGIINEDEKIIEYWVTMYGQPINKVFKFSIDEPNVTNKIYNAWKENKRSLVIDLSGDALTEFMAYRAGKGGAAVKPDEKRRIINVAFFSKGLLNVQSTEERSEESIRLLERFAAVFEQTYTRFLDLQKAEAQAREAKIEAALEKVRSRSLAMHRSNEIKEVVKTVFEKMKELGFFQNNSVMIVLPKNEFRDVVHWTFNENFETMEYYIPAFDHPASTEATKAWKNGEKTFEIYLDKQGKDKFLDLLFSETDYSKVPDNFKEYLYSTEAYNQFFAFEQHCGLLVDTFTSFAYSQNQKDIVIRFAKVFEQAYIRFLDLQKAEIQAREAQIEAALERVRARTMAMFKSDELAETAVVVFQQLIGLGIEPNRLYIGIINDESGDLEFWITDEEGKQVSNRYVVNIHKNISIKKMYEGWKEQRQTLSIDMSGNELHEWITYWNKEFDVPFMQGAGRQRRVQNLSYFSKGFIATTTFENAPKETVSLLNRFAAVFNLTYTRFNDLQLAEAQAREAQIEAALEKVRSRSLAMHKSDELEQVVVSLFDRLVELGLTFNGAGIYLFERKNKHIHLWVASKVADPVKVNLPYVADIADNLINQDLWNMTEKGDDVINKVYSGPEKDNYYRYISKYNESVIPEQVRMMMIEAESWTVSFAVEKNCILLIDSWEGRLTSNEEFKIVKRFAKVFEQAYTRFLDLQKAEAQAREAQIEAALEKVRSRSLAMHKSEELKDVVNILFEKLKELGLEFDGGAGIHLFKQGTKNAEILVASPNLTHPISNTLPYDEKEFINNPIINDVWEAKASGEHIFNKRYSFEEKNKYFNYVFKYNDNTIIPETERNFIRAAESYTATFIAEKNSLLGANSWTGQTFSIHDLEILKRFAKVFEQAYIRFLDLQKAEAQAREAQIEAALERVRSRTMGMQKSHEIADIVGKIFGELKLLDVVLNRVLIWIFNDEEKYITWWSANPEVESNAESYRIGYNDQPVFLSYLHAWQNRTPLHLYNLSGDNKKNWEDHLFTNTELSKLPEAVRKGMREEGTIFTASTISDYGLMMVGTFEPISQENIDIIQRFGRVFQQSYTRYLDVQRAETQALEAIKRASVDRVRAEIASMRTTDDLERITPLIWNELTTLGVPFVRCGVFIMDEEDKTVQSFLSTPDGKAIAGFRLPYYATEQSTNIVMHWQQKKIFRDHMDEAAFAEYTKNLMSRGAITSGEKYLIENRPADLYLHFLPFLQGMLYVGNTAPLSDEELHLMQNLADAFSTAYARYEDFNKLEAAKKQVDSTLNELQSTQKQLIQSEKMASLGELTAGIAHEIQNPLNFVNNFSEVSNELIDEMNEELEKGDIEEAKAIALDIKQNLEKINHHGKRADGIVKGMLQHSRISSGQKELTDINVLCDEYLRLSYHGLRAKDKSFNATMGVDFDKSIGNINIIPQDVGRVLLNLFNNAFYAVNEKKKQQAENYEPTVSIKTKKLDEKIEVAVKDNGNGMPKHIVDKIFQPFFTTKPTGQGTGLGLSLSYDIIKAHGGEIKVETKQGEGTNFIIQLPIN